ncbi:MAG TPA: hypothetical protein VFT87_00025 [Candidatus Saccharimonadales bacterium]|nr:hypothetical protein [Candidatus Saccharimonadales bacterium]
MSIVNKKYGHAEVHNTPFDVNYAVDHILLPANPEDVPQIVGWSGPARSGTTGLLYLMAGHPQVDRVYFQPLKTLLRKGAPDFDLRRGDKLICMKEVFRGCCASNGHDPIGMLLRAGVPANKITWVAIMREPQQNYASWVKSFKGVELTAYESAQAYSVALFNKYKDLGVNIIPFSYELLAQNEPKVVNILLKHAGLQPFADPHLAFNEEAITQKMQHGQSKEAGYFESLLQKTRERKRFVYTRNNVILPAEVTHELLKRCKARFEEFHERSRQELGL